MADPYGFGGAFDLGTEPMPTSGSGGSGSSASGGVDGNGSFSRLLVAQELISARRTVALTSVSIADP